MALTLQQLIKTPVTIGLAAGTWTPGNAPTNGTEIYETPAGKAAVVKSISLVNQDTAQRTFNLYVKTATGTVSRLANFNTPIPAGFQMVFDEEITLGPGDELWGSADTADKIDYAVSGLQRDA